MLYGVSYGWIQELLDVSYRFLPRLDWEVDAEARPADRVSPFIVGWGEEQPSVVTAHLHSSLSWLGS